MQKSSDCTFLFNTPFRFFPVLLADINIRATIRQATRQIQQIVHFGNVFHKNVHQALKIFSTFFNVIK